MSVIKRCEKYMLSYAVAWPAAIAVGSMITMTNAYLDLDVASTLFYITLVLMSSNFLPPPAFLSVAVSNVVILSNGLITDGGYLDYKLIAGLVCSLIGLLIIILLVWRNKKATSLWRRKEALFLAAQKLSHTGSVGIIIGHEISLSWSEESSRIFEYPSDVTPTLDLVRARTYPDDLSIIDSVLEQAISRQGLIEVEHRLVMPDGRVKHVQMVASPMLKDGGHIEYFGALMDVTASRQSEEALFHSQAKLAHMTRLTSMGELAASIAHEINQPLAALITSGECCKRWINRPEPDLEEAGKSVDRIIQNSVRISDVITCIRALSRQSELQRTVELFEAIVSDSLALMQHDISYHEVRSHCHLGAPSVFISGDRIQLQQVIINLIINACQAMAGVHDRARILRIHTSVNDSEVVLEVADSGSGISKDILPSLFDPFFTTKPTGLGIGLSICRSIIEFHGGRIWVNSKVGRGTQFMVALPLAPLKEN
ncbi:ATP-binding protein [Pseudomonas sp. 14P_8.1_Bac3]|uniref:sensor histidine kinase n=1 Tax=Pseudomonas sp. 14P_8.1_Bac3 TaxID=2971621 RepID=UPI0021C6515C|nr:ATP-binding protein [Pseudomonas sp. 14P_8.1_Bac3]MCU1758802.1 ATP-binding protein [Pseudomonas sp. 14P_8.1_Bac3]